jgi:inosose dehydratase
MKTMNRRTFLATGAAAAGTAVFARTAAFAQDAEEFPLGSQSYSFRTFDFEGAIAELKKIGLNQMEFFSGHIPTNADEEQMAAVLATLEAEGIHVPCFGVEGFGPNADANREKFAFGKRLGIDIFTANPDPRSFDNLEELTEEFGISIAIHNHGPGARYDKVQDTLDAVEGRSARIGACVDTGHAIRSGEAPHEVIRALGDRVISLHLKDWTHGGAEQIVGEGDMDLVEVVRALRDIQFSGPIMLEYEESPDDPGPDMAIGIENWRKAVAEA